MSRVTGFIAAIVIVVFGNLAAAHAADAPLRTIHLDQYNGYFAAQETLAGLKPGKYEFVVTNKAGKMAGFQIQSLGSRENLDMFPLEPGETRRTVVEIGTDGVRYRCPINPTPWYELDAIQAGS